MIIINALYFKCCTGTQSKNPNVILMANFQTGHKLLQTGTPVFGRKSVRNVCVIQRFRFYALFRIVYPIPLRVIDSAAGAGDWGGRGEEKRTSYTTYKYYRTQAKQQQQQ